VQFLPFFPSAPTLTSQSVPSLARPQTDSIVPVILENDYQRAVSQSGTQMVDPIVPVFQNSVDQTISPAHLRQYLPPPQTFAYQQVGSGQREQGIQQVGYGVSQQQVGSGQRPFLERGTASPFLEQGQWRDDLFYLDWESCCWTLWCVCVREGWTLERSKVGSFFLPLGIFALCCVLADLGVSSLATWWVTVLISSYYRGKLREKYNIPGSSLNDLAVHSCCWMCAVSQEARHVDYYAKMEKIV